MSDANYVAKLANGNIGVAQGSKSNGLCSIDIDHDDEIDGFLRINPALVGSLRSKGARDCNCWLRVEGEAPRLKPIKTRDGEKWGEWRGEGAQTIIHGRHPSGVPYQLLNCEHPVLISIADIVWPLHVISPFVNGANRTDDTDGTEDTDDTEEIVRSGAAAIQSVDDVIGISLPSKINANHSHLFILARAIKTLERNRGVRFKSEEKRAIFDRWYDEAAPFLRGELTKEDYLVEFLNSYRSAKYLIGDAATLAWERARKNPLPTDFAPYFKTPEMRLLLAFCFELQRLAGDRPFFLSARTAAKSLGHPTHSTAASWLGAFVGDEILDEIEKGNASTGKASRYRWAGGLERE
jgi:hypothetical protein